MERRNLLKSIGVLSAAGAAGGGALSLFASQGARAQASWTISDSTPVTTDDGQIKYVNVTASHTAAWDGFDEPVAAIAYRDTIVLDPNGSAVSHTVYDNTDSPVLLGNWSSDGSGSDGWGGPGEYIANTGSSGDQDFRLHGEANADIDWNVVADPNYAEPESVEDPYDISGSSTLEPDTDGDTDQSLIRYTKAVHFYKEDPSGSKTSDDGSTSLSPMGQQDGTVEKVESTDEFQVTVTNEEATTSGSGSGSSSTGA